MHVDCEHDATLNPSQGNTENQRAPISFKDKLDMNHPYMNFSLFSNPIWNKEEEDIVSDDDVIGENNLDDSRCPIICLTKEQKQ